MKYAVITDANVARLYGRDDFFVVAAGEQSKTLETVQYLASELVKRGYGRETTIVGMGGGMICDLAGFLAATFCRGVPLILMPTTLLAMVDAAIGGKTGVNLPEGKNLVGTTTFPERVILHLPFLETLPDVEWENGIIEILKMGLIADAELFYQFSELTLETIVRLAMEAKRRVVARDPYEKGCRAILNFGHTIGHAVETLSGFEIAHGKAVGMGIVLESRLSHQMGILPKEDLQIIESRFPPLHLHFDVDELIQKLSHDKKSRGGRPHFVLLEKIGQTAGERAHPVEERILKEVLSEACLFSC